MSSQRARLQERGWRGRPGTVTAVLALVALMGAAGLWLSPVRPSLGQQRQEIRLTGTSEQYRLALERQYTCPNPRLALPTSLLDPRHLSAPVPLPSTSPDFSLTLTYDTTVCNAFSLTISRTDKAHCAAVEASIEPSADPALSTWIKERLGPDSFIVQVDGAERRMDHTPTRYVGACEYACLLYTSPSPRDS